jgi:predicted Zn-dependent peptidase
MTEARQYLDDDDSFLWHKMMGQLFPGTTLERFYLGNEETLGRITVPVFEEFYKLYLNPKNVKIFIGTNDLKNEKKVVKLLDEFYAKNKVRGPLPQPLPIREGSQDVLSSRNILVNRNDKTQANIRLTWKIPNLNEKERIVFTVLKRILTAGFSARLMKKLRDELGLIYGISLGRVSFLGGLNYVAFATTCKKEDKEKVFNLIIEEVQKLKVDLTQTEINNVVPILEYYERRQDNVESDVGSLIDSVVYKQKYISSKEFLKLVEKVKVKDIQKLIDKIFKEGEEYRAILE